jgi:hypothetical protein
MLWLTAADVDGLAAMIISPGVMLVRTLSAFYVFAVGVLAMLVCFLEFFCWWIQPKYCNIAATQYCNVAVRPRRILSGAG